MFYFCTHDLVGRAGAGDSLMITISRTPISTNEEAIIAHLGSFTASTHFLICTSDGPSEYLPSVSPGRLWPVT